MPGVAERKRIAIEMLGKRWRQCGDHLHQCGTGAAGVQLVTDKVVLSQIALGVSIHEGQYVGREVVAYSFHSESVTPEVQVK
jgi:hypothetical protein